MQKQLTIESDNYFCKKLYCRYLTGFWIHLCLYQSEHYVSSIWIHLFQKIIKKSFGLKNPFNLFELGYVHHLFCVFEARRAFQQKFIPAYIIIVLYYFLLLSKTSPPWSTVLNLFEAVIVMVTMFIKLVLCAYWALMSFLTKKFIHTDWFTYFGDCLLWCTCREMPWVFSSVLTPTVDLISDIWHGGLKTTFLKARF